MERLVSHRVVRAVLKAWAFAALFGVVATAIYSFRGAPTDPSVPPLPTVLLAYLGGATIAGLFVGLLEPWRTTRFRRWAVGLIAAWPACYLGFGILGIGFSFSVLRVLIITAAAGVYSAAFLDAAKP